MINELARHSIETESSHDDFVFTVGNIDRHNDYLRCRR